MAYCQQKTPLPVRPKPFGTVPAFGQASCPVSWPFFCWRRLHFEWHRYLQLRKHPGQKETPIQTLLFVGGLKEKNNYSPEKIVGSGPFNTFEENMNIVIEFPSQLQCFTLSMLSS
eukprot:scpid33681/ scgid4356/ 